MRRTAYDHRAHVAASMSEAVLLARVRGLCRVLRVLVYHTHRSDRSEPGFPDCVFVGSRCVVYAELKTERGKLSTAQRAWIAALTAAGQRVYVWRPTQWLDGTIESALREIA